MKEPLPLARVQEAVLEFLRHRTDATLFGAQAVNAYVDEPRMTQDVDIFSTRAAALAEELRAHLSQTFTIAARVREVAGGKGYRVYQMRQPKNRHLADIRQVAVLPPSETVADVQVPIPEELIALKVLSCFARQGQPKGDTDRRDVKMLLLAHLALKVPDGPVLTRLHAHHAAPEVISLWHEFAREPIDSGDADEDDWDL